MQQQEQQQSSGQRSSYSHFMEEAKGIIDFKRVFENKMLVSDFSELSLREEIIDLAGIMSSEISALASDDEKITFKGILKSLYDCSGSIGTYTIAKESNFKGADLALGQGISSFKRKLHGFLEYFIKIQDRANLQFNKMKELGEMSKYLKVNEVSIAFPNNSPYRVLISPQMEFFCRGLYLRAIHNYDNIVIVDAKRGKGKSTFDLAAATTLSAMFASAPFDINTNLILNETREYCQRLLGKLPRFSNVIFDQAGNQVNTNTRWEDDQVNLLNQVDLERFHGLTMWFNWHEAKALDKDIRERVATHTITIDKRGLATVKTFNLNPSNRGVTFNPRFKNAVAVTPEQAQVIGDNDSLKLFDIPFYDMEKNNTPEALRLWNLYSDRKEKSNKFAHKITRNTFGADFLYTDFLATLEPNTVRIDTPALEAYGVSKAQALSMTVLAKKIAKATNQKIDKVFVNTNTLDLNEGYIIVDKYAGAYMERLRAEKQGAMQYRKEHDGMSKNGQ